MIARRAANFYLGEAGDVIRFLTGRRPRAEDLIAQFERRFAEYVGVAFATATCTGRYGLGLILRHLAVGPDDEIIVPAYTLADLLDVACDAGFRPVAADIDPRTFNLDPADVARRIKPCTRAILATHLFGAPCDIKAVLALARPRGVKVIEDCAHAAGACLRGRRVGVFGDAAFFSFEVIKPINAFGGGMVTTNDEALARAVAEEVRRLPARPWTTLRRLALALADEAFLRSPLFGPAAALLADPRARPALSALYWLAHRGARPRRAHLGPLQALLGLRQLAALDRRNAERRRRAQAMTALLRGAVTPQEIPPEAESTAYFYVALAPGDAEPVRRRLVEMGVDAGTGAEVTDDCAARLGQDDCPVAADVFRRAIQLPIHQRLTDGDMRRVAAAVRRAVT
jgi:dTDP-4-amino-4,6-dideoxygalactose transaminase